MKNNLKIIVLNHFDILGNRKYVDFSEIDGLNNAEELFIKNFEINQSVFSRIDKINKICKLVFINCIFNDNFKIKNAESIRLSNCKNIHNCIFGEQTKRIYIENCDYIDLRDLVNLKLNSLKIEDTLVKNLSVISKFECLEYLYLNDIYIKEHIEYNKLKRLKKLNLNGSYVDNREEYLKQFDNCNYEITFMEENLPM